MHFGPLPSHLFETLRTHGSYKPARDEFTVAEVMKAVDFLRDNYGEGTYGYMPVPDSREFVWSMLGGSMVQTEVNR